MDERLSFGAWLRQRRRILDLTQAALARRVGYTAATIKKIEQDERRPSRELAERLAEVLEVPAEQRDAFLKSARGQLAADRLATVVGGTAGARPELRPTSNLPIQRERLIGREREVAQVRALLLREDVGLLTLTGTGGIGKTRLALAVAAELLPVFPDGVWFVDLAPIRDSTLVATTIATTLGLREVPGQALTATVTAYLRVKQVLLVLDNFEQILDAAPLVAGLLAAALHLKVLVTSRAPLHVTGERDCPVLPLAVPDLTQIPLPGTLMHYSAVDLFVQRVQAVQPAFHVTAANGRIVVAICARLDGIPLALELAAARCKLFPPAALLARLDHPLALLTGGAREVPSRQRTLRATIEWSYQLLDVDEQRLFECCAMFVGGFWLAAAEAVCADQHRSLPVDDILQRLLEQGLIQTVSVTVRTPTSLPNQGSRLGMLETIREYAQERLQASEENHAWRRQHAAYYLALVQRAAPELTGPQQVVWLDWLEQEHANLRAAIQWYLDQQEIEMALQFCAALWKLWHRHGHYSEGRGWIDAALAQSQQLRTSLRAHVLYGAGWLVEGQFGGTRAQAWFEESLTLAQAVQDRFNIALALHGMGQMALNTGDYARARALCGEGLALFREVGDTEQIAWSLAQLATIAWEQGNYKQALSHGEESLVLFRELGQLWGTAKALQRLGRVALVQGDVSLAAERLQESLALNKELGNQAEIALTLRELGELALQQGDDTRAAALFRESLMRVCDIGNYVGIAESFMGLAAVATAQEQPEAAARLCGAAEAQLDVSGLEANWHEWDDWNRIVAGVRAQLDKAAFAAAWTAGRTMTLEQAIANAMVQRVDDVSGS